MPKTVFLSLVVWILVAGVSRAQDIPPEVAVVVRHVATADAQALLAASSDRIEIGLFGATRRYSRAQATYVLQDFFRSYPPRRVAVLGGAGTEKGWFGSVSYEYERGSSPLLLFVRLRREGSEWMLNELIVREED